MELSCYLKRMSVKASVEWAPRTANYEADSLALKENWGRRQHPQVGDSPGRTSHGSAGGRGHEGHACNRDTTNRWKKLRRRRQEDKMKVKDPWWGRRGGLCSAQDRRFLSQLCHFAKLHPWSGSHWSYILPVRLWRLQTGLLAGRPREFSSSVNRSAVSRGRNPDTEVTGWENPGSGELQNSVRYTSWDDQEFSVVNREVNFCQVSPPEKVACWITQEFSNLWNCCAHSLEESGTQWHGMGGEGGRGCLSLFKFPPPLLFDTPVRFRGFNFRVISEFHASWKMEVVAMVKSWQLRRQQASHGTGSLHHYGFGAVLFRLIAWWVRSCLVHDALPTFLHDGGQSYSARGHIFLCRALFEMGHRKLHFETKYRGTGSVEARSCSPCSSTVETFLVCGGHSGHRGAF